jgi:alkyl hydroperoxide reductase subunit AhpC
MIPKLSIHDWFHRYNAIDFGLNHLVFAQAHDTTTQALATLAFIPFHFHDISKKEIYQAASKASSFKKRNTKRDGFRSTIWINQLFWA